MGHPQLSAGQGWATRQTGQLPQALGRPLIRWVRMGIRRRWRLSLRARENRSTAGSGRASGRFLAVSCEYARLRAK
jgi:hypothetical protein